METKQILISRDVVFYENHFPYVDVNSSTFFPLPVPDFPIPGHPIHTDMSPSQSIPPHSSTQSPTHSSTSTHSSTPTHSHTPIQSSPSFQTSESSVSDLPQPPPLRKSTRTSKLPNYLTDYVHSVHNACSDSLCSCTITSNCIPLDLLFSPQSVCCAIPTPLPLQIPVVEPKSLTEAMIYPEWQQAVATEFSALEANNTWKLVTLPPGKEAISCRWVFKVKHNADGSIERYKARLVVKGFTQKAGIDF